MTQYVRFDNQKQFVVQDMVENLGLKVYLIKLKVIKENLGLKGLGLSPESLVPQFLHLPPVLLLLI